MDRMIDQVSHQQLAHQAAQGPSSASRVRRVIW
jgi:hypothetical protein